LRSALAGLSGVATRFATGDEEDEALELLTGGECGVSGSRRDTDDGAMRGRGMAGFGCDGVVCFGDLLVEGSSTWGGCNSCFGM
jgi:hypothetical protein